MAGTCACCEATYWRCRSASLWRWRLEILRRIVFGLRVWPGKWVCEPHWRRPREVWRLVRLNGLLGVV